MLVWNKIVTFLVGIIGCCSLLHAQTTAPFFKQISHSFIPAISSQYFYFTKDGLVWFSTNKGLTSFSGSDVTYYSNAEQVSQMGLSSINNILEDKRYNLYIATRAGLFYFNRQQRTYTRLQYKSKTTSTTLFFFTNKMFEDDDGLIYIGSVNRGMFVYNPTTQEMKHINLDRDKPEEWSARWPNSVGSFAKHFSDKNYLWVGAWNGIYRFDKRTQSFTKNFIVANPRISKHHNVPNDYLDAQHMDVVADTAIWFNSYNGGFCEYNTQTGIATQFLQGYKRKDDTWVGYTIRGVVNMGGGNYLLGVYDPGPVLFNIYTKQHEFIKPTSISSLKLVQYIAADRNGNAWVQSAGLLYAALPSAYHLQAIPMQNEPVTDQRYNEIYNAFYDNEKQEYLFTGRTTNGVYVLNKELQFKTIIPAPLFSNVFMKSMTTGNNIARDGNGYFWTTGLQTCLMKNREGGFKGIEKYYPSLAWLNRKEHTHIITTKEGNIIVRADDGTLYHIDYKTQKTDTIKLPFKEDQQPASYEVNSKLMSYDSTHNWIYFSNVNGIARYNLTTKKTDTLAVTALKGHRDLGYDYLKFILDKDSRIWILSERYGLRIVDPLTLKCADSIAFGERGLIADPCTDIKYADKDRLILKSQGSIAVYNYKMGKSIFFNKNNGFSFLAAKSIFYCNNHLFVGQSGFLEYYNLDGFNFFDPTLLAKLTNITIGNRQLYISTNDSSTQHIPLKWYDNNLDLSFSTPEYFLPERIEYAYMLHGVDKDWQYTNSLSRKVFYNNLSPGKYIFKIMSQFEGSGWKAKPAEYTIYINPAFWQTAAFKLVATLALLGFLLYLYSKRIKAIQKKEREKREHEVVLLELEAKALRAQMNPHFIFNSLNSIKSLINKGENDKAADYLTTFSKLIRTLFQNSDKREISLHEELETCKLYTRLEKMRFADKLDVLFDIDKSIDLKNIKVPALILQPFIENAIWHGLIPKGSGGVLKITVTHHNGIISCVVEDNGIGREVAAQYKAAYEGAYESKGITLTKARLSYNNLLNHISGDVTIIDKKDEAGLATGTSVVLTINQQEL